MKKWLKWVLIVLGVFAVFVATVAAYLYFSVDTRVEIQSTLPSFQNKGTLVKLDSALLPADSLTAKVNQLMKKASVYGMAVGVINNHQVVYQQYFGSRNKARQESFVPGTPFYGASFSKTILADVVIQLAEENTLQLDEPLYKYLKKPLPQYKTNLLQRLSGANSLDYSALEGDARYQKITARMCLDHTTGFPNWRWLEADQRLKIKFEPGSRYSYSGEGMFLLQVVVEELTGKTFEELATEKVFIPLKMTRSSFVWQRAYEGHYAVGHDGSGNGLGIPKRNVANAAGSLTTTLEDYTLFFQEVLDQKLPRYRAFIEPQIAIHAKQQFGPNALVDTHDNDSIQLSYGLGFGLYNSRYGKAFFKEGHQEGWQHYAVGFPSQGFALIMMANSDHAESIFKELIEYASGNMDTPWYWEVYIPYDHKN